MRSPRALSAFVLVAGLVLGTATDRIAPRSVPRAGDYWVLAGDFHVHVFPGDGAVTPFELPREAERAGLDVIAVTSHNVTWPAQLARWWADDEGPIVLIGQEITNPRYHLVGAGLRGTVDWWQPAAAAIADVHADGGIAIAAHPSRGYWDGFDDGARAALDGSEYVDADMRAGEGPPRQYVSFYDSVRAQNPDASRIGSTDFHGGQELGIVRTYILARERTAAGVVEAVRAGRTVAVDPQGGLHGESDLVQMVEANRPPGRVHVNRGWRRVAVALTWLGVLGLVLYEGQRSKVIGQRL